MCLCNKLFRLITHVLEELEPHVEVHEHVVGGVYVRVVCALLQRAVLVQPLVLLDQRAHELLLTPRHLQQPRGLLQNAAVASEQLLRGQVVRCAVVRGSVCLALQQLQLSTQLFRLGARRGQLCPLVLQLVALLGDRLLVLAQLFLVLLQLRGLGTQLG